MDATRIGAVEGLLTALVAEDDALVAARTATEVTTPGIEVSPTLGKLLHLLATVRGARRVLEFGTLAGYSTIWLARAVGPGGRVVSLELERRNAAVARRHLEAAGVSAWVDILCGPAASTSALLVERATEPFDLVLLDADKAPLPLYLDRAAALTRPGAVVVIDNVVRGGRIADDEAASDPDAAGARQALATLASDPRWDATALQTVGPKGWDGVAVAVRR
ncbi:O-methyltransferase [Propioniciclava soli]|uniref:O-methyltransferase n=1 Tax=Propioniciclava soli TaxID=2775081 RepID=A0ABZ3CA51_9ACTN|nr:O-methyltransferase [Propioniciclava soli]